MIPEPWLRGPLSDIDPLLAPISRALEQAQEDLEKHCANLADGEVWAKPFGMAPLGFHLRHIAGSLDRLTTYLEQRELSEPQFAFLHSEMTAGGACGELLQNIAIAVDRAAQAVQVLDIRRLTETRTVGQKHLPTTAIGLAIHIAEHTQRHVGQAITTCNLLKALR